MVRGRGRRPKGVRWQPRWPLVRHWVAATAGAGLASSTLVAAKVDTARWGPRSLTATLNRSSDVVMNHLGKVTMSGYSDLAW